MVSVHDVLSPLRALGPPPIGDVGQARRYAAELRAAADELRQLADGVARGHEVRSFSGPAADRHRANAADLVANLRHRATVLDEIAAQVLRDAAALERLQHAWRSRARAIVQGAEQILRAALAQLGWRMP